MEPLFYNSSLLFSNENIEKIKNSKISIAGVGGVGSIATEMLARLGVNNLKIADPDTYHEQNLNRQIFATSQTIGKNKALVAKERILSINPNCNVITYEKGVTKENVRDFCSDSDIIMALNDTESVKVLLHKVGKENKTPVIMGSRVSFNESRWSVQGKLWDYKNNSDLKTFGYTNHPNFDKFSFDEITDEMMSNYDNYIKEKKVSTLKNISEKENENYFKTISKEEFNRKINEISNGYNRHVCSVVANTAGCLAATLAMRYIIGCPQEILKIDLI